jgi:hypothetical protein
MCHQTTDGGTDGPSQAPISFAPSVDWVTALNEKAELPRQLTELYAAGSHAGEDVEDRTWWTWRCLPLPEILSHYLTQPHFSVETKGAAANAKDRPFSSINLRARS